MTNEKQHTIKETRERIKAMSGKTIDECHLKVEREWGKYLYWLIFDDDSIDEVLLFDRIQDVWNWLDYFQHQKEKNGQPADNIRDNGENA